MAITGINYLSRHNLESGNTTPHGATQVGNAVWVANNSDDQVYTYDDTVAYQSKFALPAGNGQPRGLARISKHAKVASLDNADRQIYLMSETGTDLSESYALNSANTSPEGILSFESIDEIWVANLNDNKWYRYRYTGSALTFLGTHDMHASNTDARGACYISQEQTAACLNAATKQVFIYDETGAHVRTLSLNASQSTPRAMTGVGFELWVLDNGSDDAWVYDLVSDVTVTITSGYPDRYIVAIGNDDPADTNDFPIRLDWNSVVTGFAQSDITLTGATLVSFRETIPGRQYEAILRPPASGNNATGISVRVNANAVTEGNATVTATFGYHDSPKKTALFDWNVQLPGDIQEVSLS